MSGAHVEPDGSPSQPAREPEPADTAPVSSEPVSSEPVGTEPGGSERSATEPEGAGPEPAGPAPVASGLRNPAAAVRGVGMATLILESVVLLLSIQPIRIVAPDTPSWAYGLLLLLAAACVAVAAMLRRPWGWRWGIGLQLAIIATGIFQYALFVLGAVFLAIWLYVLRVRRDVVTRPIPPTGRPDR